MYRSAAILAAVLTIAATPPPAPRAPGSHAGDETRAVKSLSEGEVAGYLAGHGMGLARPAELNHYPGPRHVLELAKELGLDDAQRVAVSASFDRMHADAVRLGKAYVEAEMKLEAFFAQGGADPAVLGALVTTAAERLAELRTVHLRAHLETRRVLTPEQINRYDALRGYGAASRPGTPDPNTDDGRTRESDPRIYLSRGKDEGHRTGFVRVARRAGAP